MNDLYLIYSKLQKWPEKFDNLVCVSIFLFKDEFRFRLDWKQGDEMPNYVNIYTLEQMENIQWFEEYESFLMEKAENAYKVWEVGEE